MDRRRLCRETVVPLSSIAADPSATTHMNDQPTTTSPTTTPPIRFSVRFDSSFGRSWLITLLVAGLLFPVFTLGYVLYWDDPLLHWNNGLYERKSLIAAQGGAMLTPRLFVVGGSGALFGIDAELIERKLGVRTVNFGTHAGLGLRYHLARVRRDLKAGDHVLLALEYELIHTDATFAPFRARMALTFDKRYFLESDPRETIRVLYSVPLADYVDSFGGWKRKLRGKAYFAGYPSEKLSANGDLRYACTPPSREFTPATDVPDAGPELIAFIRDFCAWAQEREIKVWATWANQCVPDDRSAAKYWEASVERLRQPLEAAGVTLVSPPSECHFPRGLFIDTVYHLTSSARRIRTEHLVGRLRTAMNLPGGSTAGERYDRSPLFVMGSPDHEWSTGNLFGDRPNVQFRCLSDTPTSHPDLITVGDLADEVARGRPVYYDAGDTIVAAALPRLRAGTETVALEELSLAEFLTRYANHIFVVARGGASPWPADWPVSLPPGARERLRQGGSFVHLFGTGSFRSVESSLALSGGQRRIKLGNFVEGGWETPFEIFAEASDVDSLVRISNTKYSTTGEFGLTVIALDPAAQTIVASHTFDRSLRKVAWQVNRLTPAPSTSPATAPAR